ncbi:LOW QUALITY PROTEIN: uncharacterized protein [Pagrus major]|uniref:LOW QUALITY PROTEIN: uncharacterized protein n=1 Tax=Pagrus major TaxID=143350 RepID=UPI003CC8DB1B
MGRTLLWLGASLAFASLAFLADGAPLQVMSAPNLLRLGTAENIFVECQDYRGADIRVEIIVMNHPTKAKRLASTTVTLTNETNFQQLAQIMIPVGYFSKDPNIKQYVYLQAQFPDQLLEKVVLTSFQSGYIFIQTDKTLYTPESTVHYRMFALTPLMEPVKTDNKTQTAASIDIEIVTPEGIILPLDPVSLKSEIYSENYKLGEIVSLGMWKIVARLDSNPQQSYSAEFEVKEYVLPSFEVKLTPVSPFFYVDNPELTVNIRATYLFGEEVDGMAYVVFGVIREGKKQSFPSSLQRVQINRGNGAAMLKKEYITQTFPHILNLVGSPIFVAVSVLTESGSEMVEAELRNIQIVTSPYTIHFKKTPKYFKPGMSFDVAVEVLNPDDTPAQGVAVVVDPGQVKGVTEANGMARLTINIAETSGPLQITAKTNDPRITRERQASATMTALPHTTKSNNYIHIGVNTAEVTLGENLKVNLMFTKHQQIDITYLILSRGRLVKNGRYTTKGQVLISMIEVVTKEMLPSFRIIAYYHTNDNEVVSDSVWVDVKDSCMGSLKLESSRAAPSFEPGKMFGLKVTGDPEATVGLVAVDKGVYVLNNKHRLTQKKVWDIVDKSDTGCTPGGGRDAMSVFFDAGLLFESNTTSGTPYRLELKCPAPSRRKRTTVMNVTTTLVNKYQVQLQRDCCLDGMKMTPVSYSCERRSDYIMDGAACKEAFLYCCKVMENQQAEWKEGSLRLARADEEDNSYMDSSEIVSRTKFPESWLFSEIKLPPCPKQISNCDTTTFEKKVPLQDSITTWQFTGISLSRTHGICVGEPLEVIVRKDFFIDLRLPYSAVRGEQIEVKAILHNYSPDLATVRVDLIETPDVCSSASRRGKYRQEVKVEPHTTRSVPFIIIPMKDEEDYPITVKAAVKDSSLYDGVMRKLRVVPPGVLVKSSQIVTLDPTNKGVGGTQEVIINGRIPKTAMVPNTPSRTQIFATGREQVSALVENAVTGKSMSTLIQQPSGCGEQNMARMTLPVIAATYLDKTNRWEAVGFKKREEALLHIKTGYQNQLPYRKDDGSFAVYPENQSSTWLTAYVAKVFAMANNLVAVQNYLICDAVRFLILKAQQPDGMFTEDGYVLSSTMRGDVEGRDSDASMTAFCLIALQESFTLCNKSVDGLEHSIDNAVAYLETRLPRLTYSYAVAMTSYALANAGKLNREILYNFVSPDLSHWPVPYSDVYTLEATAYALLALVKVKAFEDAKPVVRWFNQQQKVGGGYGSTQATIMVYQAVAEYWANAEEPQYELNLDILLPTKTNPVKVKYAFNRDNHYATRTSKINDINQNVKLTATGTGEATVTMVSLYYALPKENGSNCQNFDMSVQLLEDKMDENEKIYKLKIEVLFKDKVRDATMSILDIGMLTGFTVNKNDLDLLSKGHARTIAKYEMNTALSERGSLIIYLDKVRHHGFVKASFTFCHVFSFFISISPLLYISLQVSHTQREEITFRIHQPFKVGILQPAAVSVYEYYDQTPCVKFYHPERRAGQLMRLCRDQQCTCAEENCSMQKKGEISNEQRIAMACESSPTIKIDFVYKLRLEEFTDGLSTDIYIMQVVEVIKAGSFDVVPLNNNITFLSYQHCRESLDLKKGKSYLIMGTSRDIYRDDQNAAFQYILGERTWIEYWPTNAECQNAKHRFTCLGLEELVDVLTIFGCPAKIKGGRCRVRAYIDSRSGSDRRMGRTLLWLGASLAFASLAFLADGAPLQVMSAPNLLRVGTAENIFVECQDCTGADIRVEVIVMNHPTKTKRLASTIVTLTNGNSFQELAQIMIPAGDFSKDPNIKQYVYLQAQFPDRLLEKVVLASFQSGYIFIQTDKTLYTPASTVLYRMFAVTPLMEPVERDEETNTDASIAIEIVTPEGIILPLDPVSLKLGIHSGDYKLGEIVSPGLWKVVAKFHSNPQQSYFAEFEVKEYVLPSFEVKLIPLSPFFYVDSPELTVDIRARYLFGEEVDGMAYVVFGVIQEGTKKSFPGSLQRVQIARGTGVVTLKREHITQTFKTINNLVGSSIFVAVSVLTESGSEMVEAELRGIQIVTSPYTIHFKKTPKYFKPGMSFDVAVEVLNPDGTPAQGVAVLVDPGQVEGLTAANGMARLTINTEARIDSLIITAKTNDPLITRERQASASMKALQYTTKSKNYIHIGVDTAELALGDNLKINLNLNSNQDKDITYLILSRGQLVKKGRYHTRGQVLISLIVPITKEMLPSFRIIAYYHTNDNEVVSDSVWVDVKDSCMGSLKLESSRPAPSYEPRRMFRLKVTGDPEATVGLVAVDKGIYVLNNKHRLTQKKVWDIVEKYDTGCTPGGGKDGMSVFFDAGLLFESNTASGTPYRQELKCPAPSGSRRKRSNTIMNVTTTLVSKYENQMQRECCSDGMKKTPLSYTCETRSEYIGDGAACVEAFLFCCKEMENQLADRNEESLQLARSEEDDNSYMDSSEITSRTQFPESWLWSDIKLPACSRQTPNCDATTFEKNVPLQDSITTWQFTGISLSRTHGICVGEPLEVIVRKEFFIDLRLPYSAVRGEQIEVKAILHNYSPDPATVRVDLIEEVDVCSSASKRGKYRQEVKVGPQTTRAVPFIIIPMKQGQYRIEVKAAVKDSSLNDGIMRMLRVVPQGVLVKSPQIVSLDPAHKGVGGTQKVVINSDIPKKDMAPNTPASTQISVTGREQVSRLVENAISGQSMGTLIQQPAGCGEQNMIRMTLPVIAATYLDKTNKWEDVGFAKRGEALQHIKTGYQNQLAYRKNDGSFAVWAKSKSSTWLTAYVAKVFAMANNIVAVERKLICEAVKFLILNAQQPDGMFKEVGTVSHGEMIGDVRGADSDASMTAFCLIAMQESRTLCAATVNSLPGSVDKATAYLEKRLPALTNPYAVAMTSYALANENKLNREILNNFISPALSHWPVPKGRVYTLEATAYALLALVKVEAFEDAKHVVRWFNQQQKVGGGYGSTQATIMVYQAVAEYWASAKEPQYDLNVDILLPGRAKPDKFNFNKHNQYTTRTSKTNDINENVTVTATGTGEATVTMVSLYYALPNEKDSDCQKFNVSVELIPDKHDAYEMSYKLRIKVLYKDTERDATMSVLDIGLLTGFTVDTNDLNLLSKGRARTIAKYEMNTILSERGSLIIYLDKVRHQCLLPVYLFSLPCSFLFISPFLYTSLQVSHTRPEEITFRIHQTFKVGVLQPAAVSVYEYYEQTPCVKFYHPERRAGQLLRLCRGDECTCAEENCSMQKKGKVSNEQRTAMACESTQTSKIDFVYKVRLEEFKDGQSTDIYTMRVLEVIKEGSNDVGPQNQLRAFLSYQHCRESLDLTKGKTYLIMGTSKDIHRDDQNESFQYVLGERTWIEYWPTEAECQTDIHRPTCLGMEELVQQYALFGCEH